MTTVPGASCQLRLFSAGGFCWTRTPPASQRAARTEGTTTGSRTMGRHGVSSIHAALDDFVTKLKRGQLETNSIALARHATEVLIHAVAAQQAPTTQGIIDGVRAVSKEMVDARPLGASASLDRDTRAL